jgi:hypothetical protein
MFGTILGLIVIISVPFAFAFVWIWVFSVIDMIYYAYRWVFAQVGFKEEIHPDGFRILNVFVAIAYGIWRSFQPYYSPLYEANKEIPGITIALGVTWAITGILVASLELWEIHPTNRIGENLYRLHKSIVVNRAKREKEEREAREAMESYQ